MRQLLVRAESVVDVDVEPVLVAQQLAHAATGEGRGGRGGREVWGVPGIGQPTHLSFFTVLSTNPFAAGPSPGPPRALYASCTVSSVAWFGWASSPSEQRRSTWRSWTRLSSSRPVRIDAWRGQGQVVVVVVCVCVGGALGGGGGGVAWRRAADVHGAERDG